MRRRAKPPPDRHPLRVLLADDDATFRHAVVARLAAVEGIEVVGSARDGLEAVQLFSELAPDVLVMDVMMPRCDGIQATKQILAIDPAARIIAVTSAQDDRVLALCMAAGAKGCLRKGPDDIRLVPLMLLLTQSLTRSDPTSPGPIEQTRKDKTHDARAGQSDPRRQAAMHANSRPAPAPVVGAVAIAITVALTACGATTPSSSPNLALASSKHSPRIAAKIGEYSIRPDRNSAPRGRITFSIRNDGRLVHEFIVLKSRNAADALPTEHNEVKEHAAGQLVDEAENIKPGRTAKLTVRLKPGRYILLCNLRGHYRGGMHAAFRVT